MLWKQKIIVAKLRAISRQYRVQISYMCQKTIILKHRLLGAMATATTVAEEFPGRFQRPILSRPGIQYPEQATPHSDHILYKYDI